MGLFTSKREVGLAYQLGKLEVRYQLRCQRNAELRREKRMLQLRVDELESLDHVIQSGLTNSRPEVDQLRARIAELEGEVEALKAGPAKAAE